MTVAEPAKRAVFLSYASQDAEAARRLCEALRASGVEVWFDQNELVGGDAWDAKIRRQIRECGLFVPLISASTQARREAYFRLEWKLGAQRTHMMAAGTPFVLPVVIDDTREPDAIVPDEFREVQWTRLTAGEASAAFVQRVKRLGENPDEAAAPRRAVAAPFGFLGRSFAEAPQLATALAQSWNEAVKRWSDGSLPAWAVVNAGGEEAARTVRALVQAPDLDDAQKLAVALLVLNPAAPLQWQGELVTEAWVAARPEQAARLCASGVPGWLRKLRGEAWLAERAARRAAILAEMPRAETKPDAARVEQLVFGPVEEVERQLRELAEQCTGARDAVLDGLLQQEDLSLAEAVLLLAVPGSVFIRPAGSQTAAPMTGAGEVEANFLEMLNLTGHTGPVHGVSFSMGMRWLVSGGNDAAIIAWDPRSGTERRRMSGVKAAVRAVSFPPDGQTLASGGMDGVVRLWEVGIGTELRRLAEHDGAVLTLAFSPDGRYLVSAGADGQLRLWEVWTSHEVRTWRGDDGWIGCVAFSPDGRRIASSGADRWVHLWDSGSGRELWSMDGQGTVQGLAFDPAGGRLASCGGDGLVRLWDTASGAEVQQLGGHVGAVNAVAYSPRHPWLASGGADRKILLHDLRSGEVVQTLESHTNAVRCLAFSRDGQWLASGGLDQTVHVWKLTPDGAG